MVNGIQPTAPSDPTRQAQSLQATPKLEDTTFEKTLAGLIKQVDSAQVEADDSIRRLAAGESRDLHDVVLRMEEADITFRLMKEIRDKLVQAYKEVISMQM